jgi:hypothetical protein
MEKKKNLCDFSGEIGLPQRRRGRGGVLEIRKAEGKKRKNLCDLSVSAVNQVFSPLGIRNGGRIGGE